MPERVLRIRLTVMGAPRTKKNHGDVVQRGSRRFHIPSAAWTQWCETAELRHWDGRALPPMPFNCKAHFYGDRRNLQDEGLAIAGDAVGYYQGLADLLEARGVVPDDKWIVSWDGSRLFWDKEQPRVEVLLENCA
jgi:hypothetical protein